MTPPFFPQAFYMEVGVMAVLHSDTFQAWEVSVPNYWGLSLGLTALVLSRLGTVLPSNNKK